MMDERDPGLLALFDSASRAHEDDAFVTRVMADINTLRRRSVIGWLVFGIIMAPVAWWLSTPITSVLDLASQLLPDSLIVVEEQWMAQLLAPVNGVSGVVGLTILVGWWFYRKIFG